MTPRPNQSLRAHRRLLILAVTLCALATVLGNHQIAHAEPSTIRVWRTELQQVDVVDFQAYLRVVLPEEWIADWQDQDGTPESLRAGAVAVRTFGWYYVLHPQCPSVNPPNCPAVYDLTDTSQTYDPLDPNANHPNTNQAIVDTVGQYLTYNGAMLWARYGQHNGDPTVAYAGYDPPLSSVSDPIDGDESRTGHGNGVCQYGSRHWARGRSASGVPFPQWDYWRILAHYYTAIEFQAFPTNVPTYHRWNMLTTSANTPALPTNATLQVAVRIQNSSTQAYDNTSEVRNHQLVYTWYYSDGTTPVGLSGTATIPVPVQPGDDVTVTVSLNTPASTGIYVLRWDMRHQQYDSFTHEWFWDTFSQNGWPTQDQTFDVHPFPYHVYIPVAMKNYP